MKPSKLFNWIWSKKQQEEYSFDPVMTRNMKRVKDVSGI